MQPGRHSQRVPLYRMPFGQDPGLLWLLRGPPHGGARGAPCRPGDPARRDEAVGVDGAVETPLAARAARRVGGRGDAGGAQAHRGVVPERGGAPGWQERRGHLHPALRFGAGSRVRGMPGRKRTTSRTNRTRTATGERGMGSRPRGPRGPVPRDGGADARRRSTGGSRSGSERGSSFGAWSCSGARSLRSAPGARASTGTTSTRTWRCRRETAAGWNGSAATSSASAGWAGTHRPPDRG